MRDGPTPLGGSPKNSAGCPLDVLQIGGNTLHSVRNLQLIASKHFALPRLGVALLSFSVYPLAVAVCGLGVLQGFVSKHGQVVRNKANMQIT